MEHRRAHSHRAVNTVRARASGRLRPSRRLTGPFTDRLPSTRVGTVDKFQGQEAPVVIYSMATSSPEDAPRGMGFLYNPNRFNVATSRARCVCILVAAPRLFEPDCRTPNQMRWANGLCRFGELATVVNIDPQVR